MTAALALASAEAAAERRNPSPSSTAAAPVESAGAAHFRPAVARALNAADHLGLVRYAAQRYRRAARHLTFDDLVQEGVIGLMRGVERFDPSRGVRPSTHLMLWIKQAIRRAITNKDRHVRLPVYLVDRRHRCGESCAEHTLSLDVPLGGDTRTLHDCIAAPEPDERPSADELARMHAAIEALPARERHVVRCRMREQTLKQIGDSLGISRERVRQLEAAAYATLRRTLRAL